MTYIEYKYRMEFGKEEYDEIDKYCKEKGIATIISQTFQHDIGGLMSSDKHFVPRVAGFKED